MSKTGQERTQGNAVWAFWSGMFAALVLISMTFVGGAIAPQAASAAAPPCTVSDKLVNSCRAWLGSAAGKYPGMANTTRLQTEAHEARIGRKLDLVHTYHIAGDLPLNEDELYFVNRSEHDGLHQLATGECMGDRVGQ